MNEIKHKKNKNLLPLYVKGLATGKYTLSQASASTGYTVRWLSHLKQLYLKNQLTFEHKNKYRIPHNKTSHLTEIQILKIYTTKYKDVNFKYFRDCLEEFEDIKISYKTLRAVMTRAGVKSPEARKIKKREIVHRPRLRRENEGDLLQLDGTPFEWFYKFGDNEKYCIHGAIDDATGKITSLYMTKNECLFGYIEVLRQTCNNYGIPRETYTDRAAIFCVTPRNKKDLTTWEQLAGVHEKRTQWQRILEDLSINQILAWSPAAKGRVERMWRTVQGQLPQWFYNKKISTMEDANKCLQQYVNSFNNKYSVSPTSPDSFYREIDVNLDDILIAKFPKKLDNNGCFYFHDTQFTVYAPFVRNRKFTLCISELGMYAYMDEMYYPIKPVGQYIQEVIGDKMTEAEKEIIYRYLFAFAKEVSC